MERSLPTIQDILKDGCFLEEARIERLLDRLRDKKNLILQGPPGTGKTWLAKRLAFAFMGQKDDSKVRAVQFHPNLSFEDFVRGWRPTGEDGKLSIADGVFMEAIKAATKDPLSKFVVVIEEICALVTSAKSGWKTTRMIYQISLLKFWRARWKRGSAVTSVSDTDLGVRCSTGFGGESTS